MIFRLDGSIEETLALTPVMREWKITTSGKVWADTLYPELFIGNPYVDGVINNRAKSDWFMDFNNVNWQCNLKPVSESFAELLFGKRKLSSWRTFMSHTAEDESNARDLVSGKRIVVVAEGMDSKIDDFLRSKGYDILRLSGKTDNSWGVFRAIISMAELYVGFDGNEAAVALTTDTPAVIVYTYRNPVYFAPFRRGILFEAVTPNAETCNISEVCLKGNGLFELGKTYGVKCPKGEFFCEKIFPLDGIMNAVGKILEKA